MTKRNNTLTFEVEFLDASRKKVGTVDGGVNAVTAAAAAKREAPMHTDAEVAHVMRVAGGHRILVTVVNLR